MIKKGSRYPARIMKGSRAVDVLMKGNRPIWMSPAVQKAVIKQWLDANATTICHTVRETDAHWFEIEVILPATFSGNPADGWTGPMIDGYLDITLGLHWSSDLLSWTGACAGWTDAPGTWPEEIGSTLKRWRARYEVPIWWEDVMVDMSATSDRHGKSITEISVFNSVLPLNYPYTPAEIADGTLQADLRNSSLGDIPGATVTVTTGALSATGKWHTQGGAKQLVVTMSGTNVTSVTYQGSTVSASYPYAMPNQLAALNSALTSSLGGDSNNRAVVLLHSDAWEIELPDLVTSGMTRNLIIFFDPGDPNPTWNMYGEYQGMAANNIVTGSPSNTRNPSGAPLVEALKAFARLGVII